jgi:hypothetical protein
MEKTRLMMEVFPQTKDNEPVRFHAECYTFWSEERRELLS